MSCPQCKGRAYLLRTQAERAAAVVCACSSGCEKCGGRGHIFIQTEQSFSERTGSRAYDVLMPCSCQLLRRRVQLYSRAGIPAVLAQANFENFLPCNESQHRSKETALHFVTQFAKGNEMKGFVLSGPVGSGKTHLLAASLAHLTLEKGVETQYVEISFLYAEIRRGFQAGKSGGEIIQPLSEIEVLAIDEIGKGRGSPFEVETLDELIARRYNAGRVTLFATNYSLLPERRTVRSASGYRSTEEAKAALKETELLRERIGERIYSRLCEMCHFWEYPVDTPDQRRTKQELGNRTVAAGLRPRL